MHLALHMHFALRFVFQLPADIEEVNQGMESSFSEGSGVNREGLRIQGLYQRFHAE